MNQEEEPKKVDTKPRDYPPQISNEPDRAADPQKGWSGDSQSGATWSGRNWGAGRRDR